MSSFTKPLVYKPTGKRRDNRPLYVLLETFVYELGYKGSGIIITVPAGFETDFASIPSFADDWFGLDPTDKIVKKAAVIHDYLYANHGVIEALIIAVAIFIGRDVKMKSRAFADRVFLEAMGVPNRRGLARIIQNIRRHIIFLTVRIFGSRPFENYKTSNQELNS